ncbi:MAG: radical SAM protein [Elusimicrobiota bacterium]
MTRAKDDLSWYARKAASALVPLPGMEPEPERIERLRGLLNKLRAAGIKGDFGTMTLYTRRLPPGCRSCLSGQGSNLYVTGLCTRDCFFCFNQKPRKDETVVHGIPVDVPSEAPEIVARYGLRSVGLSGGEPLLRPQRVLALLEALKGMPHPPRVDLYTNGDLADDDVLRRLKDAGLDAIRFDLAARDYDAEPVRRAMRIFKEVAVEIPVVPEHKDRLQKMVLELDELKVPFLNIHELFLCAENSSRVVEDGQVPLKDQSKHLLWRPTADSAAAALELLLFAMERTHTLSVYYCSCGTQERIAANGLKRRSKRKPRLVAPT